MNKTKFPPSLTLPNCARNKISHTNELPMEKDFNIPLIIPTIGLIKTPKKSSSKLENEDPWIPPKTDGPPDIKIAAVTPIGTIAMVPTSDKRPATPKRLSITPRQHLTLKIINGTEDPILTTAIYLDCTKQEDQDYHHVSEKMRKISTNTMTLQKQYSNEYKPLIDIRGKVSHSIFEEALSIYENNQVFYQDRIDSIGEGQQDLDTIRIGLTTLEHWFGCIIEPKSQDDLISWKERELFKITKGLTAYCDPELYKYIQPFPPQIIEFIKQNHIGLL